MNSRSYRMRKSDDFIRARRIHGSFLDRALLGAVQRGRPLASPAAEGYPRVTQHAEVRDGSASERTAPPSVTRSTRAPPWSCSEMQPPLESHLNRFQAIRSGYIR